MLIDTTAQYERLKKWIDSDALRLTLDIGHLFCQGEVPLATFIQRFRRDTVNVHIEDIRAGVHEHLDVWRWRYQFSAGAESAAREVVTAAPVHVELSRHSHNAVEIATRSYEFLNKIMNTVQLGSN